MTIDKEFNITRDSLVALALANCRMILENAISMPDSYIEEHYGSDCNMCNVAERYFDFALKIMHEMPVINIRSITAMDLHLYEGDRDDGEE